MKTRLDDDFEIFAEQPPESNRNKGSKIDWETRLSKLLTLPLGWYVIAVWEKQANSARNYREKLRELYPDYEFKSWGSTKENKSKLYARILIENKTTGENAR